MDHLLSSPFFQHGRISLTIAGLGQVDLLAKYLTNLKCQDRIIYLGWINDEIKFKQLFSNHILILPSSFEGLPVSILESFSSGMPVIATRVGGIPDIVFPGINGWLFDPDNFAELDSIFCEIFNDPELVSRYGSGTLDVVRPFFSDNVKETLLKHYSSLI
jgi:glycosyltransferase involved in cell wall biosynthesis